MKNILILYLCLSVAPLSIYAQWQGANPVYFNAGNVGIGTIAPTADLHISRANASTNLLIENTSSMSDFYPGVNINNYQGSTFAHGYLMFNNARGTKSSPTALIASGASTLGTIIFSGHNGTNFVQSARISVFADQGFTSSSTASILTFSTTNLNATSFSEKMRITSGGNVGIGTTSPTTKFHVYEPTQNVLGKIETGGANTAAIIYKNNYEEWQVGNQAYGATGFTFASLSGIKMTIRSSGDVGIGTVSPDAKLAVKGTIHAQEVKVDLSVPGPDYVFEPTYNLKPLAEIETYIKKNKHLPEVPSAKEMEKNGVQLGEMNMLLLKKVEELTLYVIELKKENEEFKKRFVKIELTKTIENGH
jgi:hypothetical protein